MLRRAASDSKITSSTISGGIGDFSVKLYKGFTGSGDRQVELFINGVSKGYAMTGFRIGWAVTNTKLIKIDHFFIME